MVCKTKFSPDTRHAEGLYGVAITQQTMNKADEEKRSSSFYLSSFGLQGSS